MTFVVNRYAIGPGQQVEIFDYRRERRDVDLAVVFATGDARRGRAIPCPLLKQFKKFTSVISPSNRTTESRPVMRLRISAGSKLA